MTAECPDAQFSGGTNGIELQPKPEIIRQVAPDLSSGHPDHFPLDAFPPLLRQIAERLAFTNQTPVCLPAMAALAILSGAAGKHTVCVGGYRDKTTRCNLYVLIVAERGTGKTSTGETLVAPLATFSDELAELHQNEINAIKREMAELNSDIEALKRRARKDPTAKEALTEKRKRLEELQSKDLTPRSLWMQDATSQAMACALERNEETQFIFSTEGATVIKMALGRHCDDGSDLGILVGCWSGDRVRQHRINRKPVNLDSPCLSMLLMVQRSVRDELTVGAVAPAPRGVSARRKRATACVTARTFVAPNVVARCRSGENRPCYPQPRASERAGTSRPVRPEKSLGNRWEMARF